MSVCIFILSWFGVFLLCLVFYFFWLRWCCFVGLSFFLWMFGVSLVFYLVLGVIWVGRLFWCLLLLWCLWVLFLWFLLFIFIVFWCVIKWSVIIVRLRSFISLRFSWMGMSVVCRFCEGLRVGVGSGFVFGSL